MAPSSLVVCFFFYVATLHLRFSIVPPHVCIRLLFRSCPWVSLVVGWLLPPLSSILSLLHFQLLFSGLLLHLPHMIASSPLNIFSKPFPLLLYPQGSLFISWRLHQPPPCPCALGFSYWQFAIFSSPSFLNFLTLITRQASLIFLFQCIRAIGNIRFGKRLSIHVIISYLLALWSSHKKHFWHYIVFPAHFRSRIRWPPCSWEQATSMVLSLWSKSYLSS